MKKIRLVILGSTGSIGISALEVVQKNADRIELVGLSAHSNIKLLAEQVKKFNPKYVAVTDEGSYGEYKGIHDNSLVSLLDYSEGASFLARLDEADVVLNGIVGAAGLKASLETVRSGKRLALANKESMVIGGELIKKAAALSGAEIIPVDSEHSAIWQALFSGKQKEVKRLILTASGGPFFRLPKSQFRDITKDEALNHPTWNMGPKITVDSATMINKGFEIIEAMRLFDVPADKIDVIIHPQSIIHSMIEFVDSSMIAQMSYPDMKLPIAYALFYPERVVGDFGQLNLAEIGQLTFINPDFEKFPLLKLAYRVAEIGGTAPAVYNAANEVAVEAFLNESLDFWRIPDIIISTIDKHDAVENPTLEDILAADKWARETAAKCEGALP
jgi:1-deoxy-D-xylulose-5-phosphate reductoisomerase